MNAGRPADIGVYTPAWKDPVVIGCVTVLMIVFIASLFL
jgi:hypothetical protein